MSVWSVLRKLGHPLRGGDRALRGGDSGDRDMVCQAVFEQASEVIELADIFEGLGATRDWPECGSAEWQRLRTKALTIVVGRLAREGRLAGITVSPGAGAGAEAPRRKRGEGSEVAAAMIRRIGDNPGVGFRCLKRETPLKVIMRWARETCPDAPQERLVALKDALSEVAWVDDDGHILGSVMLRELEAERDAACDDPQEMLAYAEFDEAIDALRRVLERLALL